VNITSIQFSDIVSWRTGEYYVNSVFRCRFMTYRWVLRQFSFVCFGQQIRSFGFGVAELGSERHHFHCCSRIELDNFFKFALYCIGHGKARAVAAAPVMRFRNTACANGDFWYDPYLYDVYLGVYVQTCISCMPSTSGNLASRTFISNDTSTLPNQNKSQISQFYQMNTCRAECHGRDRLTRF
jgi:hypothetical protein